MQVRVTRKSRISRALLLLLVAPAVVLTVWSQLQPAQSEDGPETDPTFNDLAFHDPDFEPREAVSADCAASRTLAGSDVVLLIGQSNMSGTGRGYDAAIDGAQDPRIQQWSRAGTVVPASEMLQHADWEPGSQRVGMGTSFARTYLTTIPAARDVLLVPASFGGTGLVNGKGRWTPGKDLFDDAAARLTAALHSDPANCIAAILWHQGEHDVANSNYAVELDAMIATLRSREPRAEKVPFILGEFAPAWVPNDQQVRDTLAVINDTPNRLFFTAVAPSKGLPSNDGDAIHFSAQGMRAYGVRYFQALSVALENAPTDPPAPSREY